MSNSKQFESGNYNSWYESVTNTMPKINNVVRNDIIPSLDTVLNSMLGQYSDIIKKSINMSYIINDTSIDGMLCNILYYIEDFKVQNVPDEAVKKDTDAISYVFNDKKYKIREIKINTNSGELNIIFEFMYDELLKEDDKA